MIAPNYKPEVQGYIDGVLSGKIPTGRLVKLCVRRHVRDLEYGHTRGLYFDESAANGAIQFFPMLKHTTGQYSGDPFELRAWQKFIIWCLFGWMRDDGTRRFRDAMISIARGNGKSPLAAACALLGFCMDMPIEDRAEVYCAATKRDQAKIVFDEATRFVENSELKRLIEVQKVNLTVPSNYSKFEPLGSDSKNTDGLVPHFVVKDEIHAWREHHRELWDKLETAMGKRRQPMALKITTAGDEAALLWKEQHRFSTKVLDQMVSPPADPDDWFGDDHFAYIAEVDKDDDIYDESNWPKANPMLLEPESPVKISHLRSMASKAKGGDIVSENRFRRYHCNQETASLEKAVSPELWAKGNVELTVSPNARAYAGLDLARSDDFAAISLVFPVDVEGVLHHECKTWAFTCEERTDDLNAEDFLTLIGKDNLTVCPGSQIEFRAIKDKMEQLAELYDIRIWAYDASWARETGQWMQNDMGWEAIPFTQTPAHYNEPATKFISNLKKGRIRHGGDFVLQWQALNLILKRNSADLRMPDKENSLNKIDSMVALLMAYSHALIATNAPAGSIYDTDERADGLLTV